MNWDMYTDKVIEHFMSPRNVGSMIEPDGDISNALDGLPESKLHCSVLGASALKNAIMNYYERNYD